MNFFARSFSFADREPPVVIGEIGVNHNGDAGLARRLVDVALAAGVDVVKFQAFKTEKEISRFAPLAPYQQAGAGEAGNQLETCKALELAPAALAELKAYCERRGIGFLCSVFDFDSLRALSELGVTAVKVASGEVTNHPLLQAIAALNLDVILSTGGSTIEEVGEAVSVLKGAGCGQIVLLHCVSSYPAPLADLNLRAMATMRERFGLPVGFSDHTVGIEAAIAATALGAIAVEKHFTLDRSMPGPDHAASAEPAELAALVAAVRAVKTALGDGIKRAAASELDNLPLIRRGLVAERRLRAGTRLTRDMIEVKRPASGIDPRELERVIGRRLNRDLEEDQPIEWAGLD